jgi:hypothetical protein
MDGLVKSLPEIIKEAAASPLGILALMIIGLAILAFFFFRGAAEKIKVVIFVMLFFGVVAFGAVVVSKVIFPPAPAPPSPTPTPTPITPTPIVTPHGLTLVASIWRAESGQRSTMLATEEFSSGKGPGVSRTSLNEFAKWVSDKLDLTARQGAPVRIGVEKFAGPDKITERVCNELKASPLIQIVDPSMLETVRSDYIISGTVKPKTP